MRQVIEETIENFIYTDDIETLVRSQAAAGNAFTNDAKNEEIAKKIEEAKAYLIKNFDLYELSLVQPTFKWKSDENSQKYDQDEEDRQPPCYGIDDIKSGNIPEQKLLDFTVKLLVFDLINNNTLAIIGDNNDAWSDDIFKSLNDSKKLVEDFTVEKYNELRESSVMKNLREKFFDEFVYSDGSKDYELKKDVTMDQVLNEIKSLSLQSEEAKTLWDYIKHYIQKLVELLRLKSVEKTSLEEKEEKNQAIRENNLLKTFVEKYESEVKQGLGIKA